MFTVSGVPELFQFLIPYPMQPMVEIMQSQYGSAVSMLPSPNSIGALLFAKKNRRLSPAVCRYYVHAVHVCLDTLNRTAGLDDAVTVICIKIAVHMVVDCVHEVSFSDCNTKMSSSIKQKR